MNFEAQKLKQLGNNAYKKRDFAIALENYGKAIDQEPTEITYYLNIAAVHLEMKNFTECVIKYHQYLIKYILAGTMIFITRKPSIKDSVSQIVPKKKLQILCWTFYSRFHFIFRLLFYFF